MNLLRAAATVLTLFLVTLSAQGPFDTPSARAQGGQKATHDYPVQPVPFTAVHLTDVFWAPRIETNRTVTIPAAFQKCELSRGASTTSSAPRRPCAAKQHDNEGAGLSRSTTPTSTR